MVTGLAKRGETAAPHALVLAEFTARAALPLSDELCDALGCLRGSIEPNQCVLLSMTLAFLGSDASRYVNGVNLNVDMGFSAFMTTGQLDFSGLA